MALQVPPLALNLVTVVIVRYKAAGKQMNPESYEFFLLRLADLHNKWLISEGSSRTHTGKKGQENAVGGSTMQA